MSPTAYPSTAVRRSALVAAAVLLCGATLSHAQRVYEQQPFDRVILNSANGGAVLKVRPLEFPNRRVPSPFPSGRLALQLTDNPAVPYEVAWNDIERIEFFEEIILKEATGLVGSGKFDEAFDYFQRLHSQHPETPGLQDATSRYLQQNALAVFKAGDFDRALAMLASLYERQPSFRGLSRAIDTVAGQIIERHLKDEDWRAARSVLDVIEKQFAALGLTVVDKYRAQFQKDADNQVRAGVVHYRNKEYREARSAALRARAIWPDHEQAARLIQLVQRDNPAVVVGVRAMAPASMAPRIDSPESLRTGYLAAPTLTRIADYSPEGGIYASPIGAVGLDPTGREMTLTVLDYPAESPAALDAPAAVARWLLKAADPNHAQHVASLASVVGSVLVPEPDLLVVGLARSHVRPEGLLQGVLLEDCQLSPPFGTFRATAVDESTVELNAMSTGSAVSVIEERLLDTDATAAAALTRGDVDILDRVAPWQATGLRSNRDIVVGQYRLPTVHVLIPARGKKILDSRDFRRALCYGIDRERILREIVQGGVQLPGYQLISGPFPTGMSLGDPVRYGYNDAVRPRPYEPRLAALLSALAWNNVQAAEIAERKKADNEEQESEEQDPVEPPAEAFPQLRLAHSSDPVARTACEAIRLQLNPLGIPIELVELSAEDLHDPDGGFDLRYAELAVWEPLVDARRLLGPEGLAGRCSDPMFAALRRLDEARNWNSVLATLRDIHELAAGDLPVIPLWQTANYYAYRRQLVGLPGSTIHLYQTVGDWRKEFRTATR